MRLSAWVKKTGLLLGVCLLLCGCEGKKPTNSGIFTENGFQKEKTFPHGYKGIWKRMIFCRANTSWEIQDFGLPENTEINACRTECISETDVENIVKMIEQAKPVILRATSTPWRIISEESEAYFQGEKSLDTVLQLIQKRMTLYLEEKNGF